MYPFQSVYSLPLQAQVFLNQLYKTPVELRLEKNPDLRAIRFASFNPILDPWIYILLRKAVLLKVIEKSKCLFCKIGARRQQRQGNFNCIDAHQLSSVISKQNSLSLVSHDLRDVTNSSQTFLYLPEGSEMYTGSCHKADRKSGSRPSLVGNSQAFSLSEQGSVETQIKEGESVTRDLPARHVQKTQHFRCRWAVRQWGRNTSDLPVVRRNYSLYFEVHCLLNNFSISQLLNLWKIGDCARQ